MASPGKPEERDSGGWRTLGLFWAALIALVVGIGGLLQFMGPPATHVAVNRDLPTPATRAPSGRTPDVVIVRETPGPITPPDPALWEAEEKGAPGHLPRIAPDGRVPMRVYAAGFDGRDHLPRAAILLAGIGMNEAESEAAIRALPGTVSLAVSPYADHPDAILSAARAAGHEYLIAIPLEPTGYPLNDPGPRTLLTSAPPEENTRRLRWALSRIDGYAGATGIVGTMRGERLARMPDLMEPVLSELSGRGLFYVDPREGGGGVSKAWGRHVDMVVDEPGTAESIDARLAALEQKARDHGAALGLIMRPTPVAVARLAAWTNGMAARGVALAPVSNLGLPPIDVTPEARRFRIE
jgi:polysaccharide deacetylase 2 family uncharacterized protein YibQ